jgi:hypothetical protein
MEITGCFPIYSSHNFLSFEIFNPSKMLLSPSTEKSVPAYSYSEIYQNVLVW